MIKALNIASQGLQQAERRATDLASKILESTASKASFTLDTAEDAGQTQTVKASPATPANAVGYSDLLQHMVDLKAEEHSFKANATVFKRLDETYDDALGSLLNEEG
ncbi:MAG: hypothetical protein HWE25_01750 [Alphaproteobacteria bacterium]|nr:hypothetical protein [Alphaproteobacteria bacterium]